MSDDIYLKPMESGDFDDNVAAWYQNNDGHLDYFTGSRRSFSLQELKQNFETSQQDQKNLYLLILSSKGQKIGTIRIGPIDHINKTSDLVCLIGNRNFLGKKLAQKAIRLANQIAFEQLDIRRLHSGMYDTNIPSIKAYTAAGWFVEATFQGYYYIDNAPVNRVCVACLNPKYFPEQKA